SNPRCLFRAARTGLSAHPRTITRCERFLYRETRSRFARRILQSTAANLRASSLCPCAGLLAAQNCPGYRPRAIPNSHHPRTSRDSPATAYHLPARANTREMQDCLRPPRTADMRHSRSPREYKAGCRARRAESTRDVAARAVHRYRGRTNLYRPMHLDTRPDANQSRANSSTCAKDDYEAIAWSKRWDDLRNAQRMDRQREKSGLGLREQPPP